MPYSYNGWYASEDLATRDLFVGNVEVVPGVLDDDDVWTVLRYIGQRWNDEVEPLVRGWCWGYHFRLTTGDPSTLSCHSSGTAADFNAPLHPFGVSIYANLNQRQIDKIHEIIADMPVVWGGDYRNTPDGMHIEIMGSKAAVKAAADRIRSGFYTKDGFDMADLSDLRNIVPTAEQVAKAVLDTRIVVTKADGTETKKTIEALIRETWQKSR